MLLENHLRTAACERRLATERQQKRAIAGAVETAEEILLGGELGSTGRRIEGYEEGLHWVAT